MRKNLQATLSESLESQLKPADGVAALSEVQPLHLQSFVSTSQHVNKEGLTPQNHDPNAGWFFD